MYVWFLSTSCCFCVYVGERSTANLLSWQESYSIRSIHILRTFLFLLQKLFSPFPTHGTSEFSPTSEETLYTACLYQQEGNGMIGTYFFRSLSKSQNICRTSCFRCSKKLASSIFNIYFVAVWLQIVHGTSYYVGRV